MSNQTPAISPDALAERLLRILSSQSALYQRLADLSPRQRELIERSDAEGLIGLLGERQRIVDEVSSINEEMLTVQRALEGVAGGLSSGARERVRASMDGLRSLIGAIAANDEADRRSLHEQRERVRREMQSLGNARSAVSAYAKPESGPSVPRYQDRRA